MSRYSSTLITGHTTCSTPTLHVLYLVQVTKNDGTTYEIRRRFSEFLALQKVIQDSFPMPAKRCVANALIPSAWAYDDLIEERKEGLQGYLTALLDDPRHCQHIALDCFLSSGAFEVDIPKPMSEIKGNNEQKQAPLSDDQRTPIAASYYPSWAIYTYPPEQIKFSKFDVLFFAFITPTGTASISWDDGSEETLRRLVTAARQSGHSTKIVLSVGGWGGSHWFSQAMSNAINRAKLVTVLSGIVNFHGLDGVDIDWEYPNAPGNGNPHLLEDADNLLRFFQLLRAALGPGRIISAAVTHQPWLGADGRSMRDVSAFAAELTLVNIMNYDVFGASENPGPNAPLGNLCGSSTRPMASAHAALAQWTEAGMPASKLLLGLPLYGYVSKSWATRLSGSSMPGTSFYPHPKITMVDGLNGAPGGDLSGFWGQQISFRQLVSMGALKRNPDGNYGGTNGYTMGWDDCSDTPYLFNNGRSTVVTYDDTYSIASKAQFAKTAGLAGCFTWSFDQDDAMVLHHTMLSNLGRPYILQNDAEDHGRINVASRL